MNMTEHKTIAGNVYCVTCAEGCTVTDSSGQLNEECEAGKQLHVTAPSGVLFTSAPATVRKVNFKNAPVKLKLLGLLGGGANTGLPSEYLAAEFLESTGTQYIDTGILFSTAMRLHADVEPLNYPPSDAYILFGSDAISSSNKNLLYFRALGNDSRWMFSVGVGGKHSATILGSNKELRRYVIDYDGKAHVLTCDGVTHNTFNGEGELPTTLSLFALHRLWYDDPNNIGFASSGKKRVYYFTVEDGDKACNFIPALDSIGTPCMFDKVTNKPFYNSGTGSFIVGMTLKQARKLGKLPAGGGTLTVSLPSNYQEDEGVVNALATAQERGWVITIQTYEAEAGTASTFALRRIWVRKRADEQGAYVDADGTRWQVEWCVDVVGADPEQEGYEPFRSVDVAVEYWGLTAWVDPEQEELLTNTEEV